MRFKPTRLYRLARSKAYLYAGVEIRWRCDPALIGDDTPPEAVFQFPGGLADHLREQLGERACATAEPFIGRQEFPNGAGIGRMGGGVAALFGRLLLLLLQHHPDPDGGTHEHGLRAAIIKGLRGFAELVGNKKAKDLAPEDVVTDVELMLSVFIREPQFQSQTKDRLTSPEAARLVESAVRDHFDHFLSDNMDRGKALLGFVLDRMDERLKPRAEREVKRKTATSGAQAAPARQAHRLRQ
jgi:topoisomerase-4 subunit B